MTHPAVRAPKQRRSQESLARVLDASKSLLAEKGFDAFTIQDVSQRADVSVGAIYARFGSKESLLRVVHGQLMDAIRLQHEASFDALNGGRPKPARELIAGAVRTMADITSRNEKLLRPFMHLGAFDDEIARRGSEASIDLARRFSATVLAGRDEIAHPDPETAVDVAYRLAYSTFARQIMYVPVFESDHRIEWDRLVDEVGAACAAYLLGERAGARRTGRTRPSS